MAKRSVLPVSSTTPALVDMIMRFYEFRGYELEDEEGFWPRDICVLYRMKGRILANHLPGIGAEAKWLGRKTDDYESQ